MLSAWRIAVSRRSIIRHLGTCKNLHPHTTWRAESDSAQRSFLLQTKTLLWSPRGSFTRGLATERDLDKDFDDVDQSGTEESECSIQESGSDYEDTYKSNGQDSISDFEEGPSDYGSSGEDTSEERIPVKRQQVRKPPGQCKSLLKSIEDRSSDYGSSDEAPIEEKASLKRQQVKTAPAQNGDLLESSDSEDEADDSNASTEFSDQFPVKSLLDMKTDTVVQDMGDLKRPLWMRIEEAANSKQSPGVQKQSMKDVIKAWVDEGNPLTRGVIVFSITVLRRRKKYYQALELSDWVITEKPYSLEEMDYIIRVELISKVHGVEKAARYFETIPLQYQTPMAYSILLTVYVDRDMEKEAVQLLKKVDRAGMEHRTYMYNQLLVLYKKNGNIKGVTDVLQLMDQKGVRPDVCTYNVILDVKARKGDVDNMERVWDQMQKESKVEPDAGSYAILAKGYLVAGSVEKALEATKNIETSAFRRKRVARKIALKLYGELGQKAEVERIWNMVNGNPKVSVAEFMTMIEAMGKCSNSVERAEEVFEEMEEKYGIKHVHQYNALLAVYAERGMAQKGEKLLKKLLKGSFSPNPTTYHHLVQMYLNAGDEKKAMNVFEKARKATKSSFRNRPMYLTFHTLIEFFAEGGDVKRAEKMIKGLKDAGYTCAYKSYAALIKAYVKAEMTPYGFLDRLRADNLIPNQYIRGELKKLDGT